MITFIEQGNRIATENFEIGEIYTITFTNGNYKTMCCIGLGSDFVMFQDKLPNALFCLTLGTAATVSTIEIGGGGSGTMNYNELDNKPQINGIVLIGNKTAADLNLASTSDLAGKQDSLTETQLTAVNSGITSSLVTQIGTNTTAISGKQDQLTPTQLTAVNSGITSSLVTQIGTNTTAISGKQDALSASQLTAVNSGITSSLVTQITTNQNNISKITPTTTYKVNHAFQSANYELINDVYIDVPDGKRIFLVVGAKQSNVIGIAVCFNTQTYDATKIVISQEVSTAQQMISCAGCYDNGNGGQSYRLNVFAKGVAGSQLNCRVTLSWWYL